MKNNERGLKGLAKSFHYAISGIFQCIVAERNIRIHLVVALYVLYFSHFYNLSRGEYILLFMVICLVLATEMLNTAIETTIDLVTQAYARLAKIAKDVAAGAVLVMAFLSVFVGFMLFYDLKIMELILRYFTGNILHMGLLVLSAVAAALFILKIGKLSKIIDNTLSSNDEKNFK